jgi:hypothetical protein
LAADAALVHWYEIEVEIGGSFTKTRQVTGTSITNSSERGLFLSFGYRFDF